MLPYSIENELRPGEILYWQGKPKAGLIFRSTDLILIPFGLIWGSGVWTSMKGLSFNPKTPGVNLEINLPAILLTLVACYLIFGRFILDAWIRKNTSYAVTSERAIIVSGLFSRRVQSINLKTIPDISVTEKSNGRGTISFADSALPFGRTYRGLYSLSGQGMAFEMIDDVRHVNSLLQKSRQN